MASSKKLSRDLDELRAGLTGLVKPYGVGLERLDQKQHVLVYQFFQNGVDPQLVRDSIAKVEECCRGFLRGTLRERGSSCVVRLRDEGYRELVTSPTALYLKDRRRKSKRTVEEIHSRFLLKREVIITNSDPGRYFPTLKLKIELVPQTCWYKNLRGMMPRSRWDALRKKICENAGQACQVCGAGGTLYCHEVWEYDADGRIQRLTGFRAICNMCNFVTHIGKAQQLAREDRLDMESVIRHFTSVNQVDRDLFEAYRLDAFRQWREQSQLKWQVDLGKWSSLVSDANAERSDPGKRTAARRPFFSL